MPRRRSAVKPSIRQASICEFVERRGQVSVDELAERFDTSPETVRRDLSSLANAGRVQKVHGGARKVSQIGEGLFEERMTRNTLAKRLIAEKVAKVIHPNQSLLIDTGSTTLMCAEALARIRGLTVITNSTRIADAFAKGSGGADVILLGGSYRADNSQTVGPSTIAEISGFHTDHAIVTVGALDASHASDFSKEEAYVARAMIASAESVTVVADSSKLERRSTFHVCDLNQIDRLVLDRTPAKGLSDAFNSAKVEVL